MAGQGNGNSFAAQLDEGHPVILGRDTLNLANPTVSKIHVLILRMQDQLLFAGLGSNGTLFNGVKDTTLLLDALPGQDVDLILAEEDVRVTVRRQ